jgi:hypothetical protein
MPIASDLIRIVMVLLIVGWISTSLYYFIVALMVRRDGLRDVQVRHEMQINTGRERLANLVVAMATFKVAAFGIWFGCGIYVASAALVPGRGPEWRVLIVPLCLFLGQQLIGRSLVHFHNERKMVYSTDYALEQKRLEAAANRVAQNMESNTAALNANTSATREATDMVLQIHNDTDQAG